MEVAIDADTQLDYAAFQIFSRNKRFEAFACVEGKREKLSSGLLEQLLAHLPAVKDLSNGPGGLLKLELPESLRGASWFTKHTLERFLHVVGAPELLKAANAIENEMTQLVEARKFHLTLYTQGGRDHSTNGAIDGGYLERTELPPEHRVQATLSDATKNELLRAMDLRLTASRGELISSFNRATGGACSIEQIADLAAFTQHFGAEDLRNSLLKFLALIHNNQPADAGREKPVFSHSTNGASGKITVEIAPGGLGVPTSISPAKIADAERHSSTESEDSCNSSNEGESTVERSRPVIRSASPRRSASPMRRIQIGRSGSRKSTALTIKSLSYFPARERISSNRDATGNSSDDGESIQAPKKPENSVRRMSVQDAINLFESKQRDQHLDLQTRRSSAEISVNTKKSVLRRWSAGMSDCSSTSCPPENTSNSDYSIPLENPDLGPMQKNPSEVKPESGLPAENQSPAKADDIDASFTGHKMATCPTDGSADLVTAKSEEICDRISASVEWNRQKETELNQMLFKMMENKPIRYRNVASVPRRNQEFSGRNQELSGEHRGGFYDHYREKRDEKLRGQNAGKRAEKAAQFKAMQEVLEQRKAEMTGKNVGITGKQDSPVQSQKLMRNSSPTLPKKESPKSTSKPAGSRKALPKTSPLPATRSSWPSAASPRTALPTSKTSNGISNAGATPNRRKSQTLPSPTRSSPKTERPQQQQKGSKGVPPESKHSSKAKGEKEQSTVRKSSNAVKTLAAFGDDSGTVLAKPSFYSKVTKKSSVVPLESKPFLRKGTGIGPGAGPVIVKTKATQSDESSKNSSNVFQAQEEAVAGTTEMLVQQPEGNTGQSETDAADPETPVESIQKSDIVEFPDNFFTEANNCITKTDEFPVETAAGNDLVISASAWVEIEEHPELPVSCEDPPLEMTIPAAIVAPAASASSRVRHSLSQMLQADSGESEIIEWGNAENPPAMVYQKDAPKGLKRLLKFARKSRGEAMLTGSASPSVFSEGEEDGDEPKPVGKRNADAPLKKAGFQEKGFGQQKTVFGTSYDGGNSSKRTVEHAASHELLPAQSKVSSYAAQNSSHNSREGQISATSNSTKGSRSFFSLSTFRSKSSETKLR